MFQPNANLTATWRNDRLYLWTPTCLRVWRGWPHLDALRRDQLSWRVDVPPDFRTEEVQMACATALRWWEGRYWAAWDRGQAELSLGADLPQHFANAPAWRAFFATFPSEILKQVRGFLTGHWLCLQLAARVPEAHELLTANPNLFWLIAHRRLFAPHLTPLSEAARLLRLPQRMALMDLGFPGVPGLDRIVQRVDTCWVAAPEVAKRLRAALAEPATAKLLRHYAADVFRVNLLTDPALRPWLTAQLLAACKRALSKEWTWSLNDLAGAELVGIQPQPIRTIKQLERWAQRIAAVRENRTLPRAPLPPRDVQMIALSDVESLRQEGLEMRNCLAGDRLTSYVRDIEAGRLYVYRLMRPRMTLAIARGDDGRWELSDLRAPCNNPARLDAADEIECWLAEANDLRESRRRSEADSRAHGAPMSSDANCGWFRDGLEAS